MDSLHFPELERSRIERYVREAERCRLVSQALAARQTQRRDRDAAAVRPWRRAILVAASSLLRLGH